MEFNSRQLILSREYRGLTQTQLANNITGLSQSNLSKFEKGLGGYLSDDIKAKIIDHLKFPKEFFSLKILNNPENEHYRKKATITKKQRDRISTSIKFIGYIVDQMADSVEFPDMRIKQIDLIEDGSTPEEAAKYIRKYLGINPLEPIKNIYSLLENNGVIVKELECDDFFDGVSFITDEGYYVIVLNESFTNDRKRFTLAHELGHIVMHMNNSFFISEKNRDKEKEAHQFAAELLMPEQGIKYSLKGLRFGNLLELKKYWFTSMASIIHRAHSLKCVNDRQYTNLSIELSRCGYRKREPFETPIDKPVLFSKAYSLIKNELHYTQEEIAKTYALPLDIINKLVSNHKFITPKIIRL
jgi:Zn-dependent peptidase ImmA (M78 family)/transcriptional regulator with XRE-family HTH domain